MVVGTNYFGTKNVIEAMIPLMKPSAVGARIVNVSTRLGRLNGRRNVSGNSHVSFLCASLIVYIHSGYLLISLRFSILRTFYES